MTLRGRAINGEVAYRAVADLRGERASENIDEMVTTGAQPRQPEQLDP
jgi:hypothetical protein